MTAIDDLMMRACLREHQICTTVASPSLGKRTNMPVLKLH